MSIMNILLVEDGDYKSKRVFDFIKYEFPDVEITIRKSYSSALKELTSNTFNLAIIDLSLPTFDSDNGEDGGEFRAYGGLDIAKQMKRRKISLPFLFLTQYSSFSNDGTSLKINDIQTIANNEHVNFLGCIYYEHSNSKWQTELKDIIKDEYDPNR